MTSLDPSMDYETFFKKNLKEPTHIGRNSIGLNFMTSTLFLKFQLIGNLKFSFCPITLFKVIKHKQRV
jgi:hypothetical protein